MAPRETFLGEWLRQPWIALLSAGSSGIAGYGVARRCREGFKVGSLFADATDVALARMADLPDATAGKELHVDVPAGQVQFTAMLQAAGLVPGFTTTCMYKGGKPGNAPLDGFRRHDARTGMIALRSLFCLAGPCDMAR